MTLAPPTPAAGALRWYAAQVQPRKERLALIHLARQNFVTHCPAVTRTRRLRGRSVSVSEPLFPGYVFVALDCGRDPWRSVNGTIGVSRLVSFGTQPAALPAGFIEQLQRLAGEGGEVRFDDAPNQGDAVRIVGGPFDDLCGTLASGGSRERVTVLLQLLSGELKVSLPRASLAAV
jgi:transcription elongation factor/antiterminator RfaH